MLFIGTGGGPATNNKLSDLEERAISVWGAEVITGNQMGSSGLGNMEGSDHQNTQDVEELVDVDSSMNTVDKPVEKGERADDKRADDKRARGKRSREVQRQRQRVEPRSEAILAAMTKTDDKIATAISELAVSVENLANAQNAMAQALVDMSSNHMDEIKMLIELIREERNN